jgi:AhpD family alkylhydroperoxidase
MRKKAVSGRIEELNRSRKKAHARLIKSGSPAYKRFLELEEAAYSSRKLDRKTKLLIGTGISVVLNCEACMQWHVEEAAAAGATPEELIEAIEVAIKMGGGPAVVAARLALEVMDGVLKAKGGRAS